MSVVKLSRPVPLRNRKEVVKNLYWIDSRIGEIRFIGDEGTDLSVEAVAGQEIPDAILKKVKVHAESLARSLDMLVEKEIFHNDGPRGHWMAEDPSERMEALGWLQRAGEGVYRRFGPLLKLHRSLDALFRDMSLGLVSEERDFPVLIETETVKKAGYLHSFPHNANFVTHLCPDEDRVAEFKESLHADGPTRTGDCCAPTSTHMLSPTVCYHFYDLHRGRRIGPGEVLGTTVVSKCFRYEGKAMRGLERLREFSMREIIFVGEPEAILRRRESLQELFRNLSVRLGLTAVLKTASDPFFIDTLSAKRLYQVGFDLKQELKAFLPYSGDDLAVGSVNYHQDHFGKDFGMTLADGSPAHSCCLGFGIDRWCLAVVAQFGLDPVNWPLPLAAEGGSP